jgi:hypothetical protein
MSQNISIPAAGDQTLLPSNVEFQFTATQNCTLCFSAASTPGTFPGIAGKTFQCVSGQILGPYPIPANAGDNVHFNTSAPNSICNPMGLADTGHVIIVGSGAIGKKRSKKKAKKAPAKKKAVAKKVSSKTVARRKPAKKAAKKATRKAPTKKAPKKAAKKAAKKKSAKKSRR